MPIATSPPGAAPAADSTSCRVTVPSGPLGVSVVRSTPRSLASLRTGGLASTRTSPPFGSWLGEVAGTAVDRASGAPTAAPCRSESVTTAETICDTVSCCWVTFWLNVSWTSARAVNSPAASSMGLRRGRRVAPRSAFIRPTRDSPSPPPLAAGLDRSISAGGSSAGAPPPAAGSPIAMIGVPTGTVSPSLTSSAVTSPAYGEGSSTRDLAVSISTTMSLTATTSPTLTFQVTISASVRPSPTSGSRYSGISQPFRSGQYASVRSTASRTRSRSGRKSSSIRAGGYGVSKPPTRSTGASRE